MLIYQSLWHFNAINRSWNHFMILSFFLFISTCFLELVKEKYNNILVKYGQCGKILAKMEMQMDEDAIKNIYIYILLSFE